MRLCMQSEKEVAPVDLDRFARWAGEIARGASRRTPKRRAAAVNCARAAELHTLAHVPVGAGNAKSGAGIRSRKFAH